MWHSKFQPKSAYKGNTMVEPNEAMRELKEEIRHEQWQQFWKRFGNYFVAASIGIVLATIGIQAWKSYSRTQSESATAIILEANNALEKDNAGRAAELLSDVKGSSGNKAVAQLKRAEALAAEKKVDEAVKNYKDIAKNASFDPAMRDLALIRAFVLHMDYPSAPEVSLEEASLPGRPFTYTALELRALSLLKKGKTQDALSLYTALRNADAAPNSIRQRANDILSAYGEAPVAAPAEPAAQSATEPAKE